MASSNINKRGLSKSVLTNEYETCSGFTGLEMETQGNRREANDTLMVLLIAAITLCGAGLAGAALWMSLH